MSSDASKEALERGAPAATKDTEFTNGIYEDSKADIARGGLTTDSLAGGKTADSNKGPSVFDAKGAIGGAFTKDGAVGGIGENVGGPLSSEGMIGKNFNSDGAIGGSVQSALGGGK